VTDLKSAICAGSEGELPFNARKGREVRYADLTSGLAGGFRWSGGGRGRQAAVSPAATSISMTWRSVIYAMCEGWTPPPVGDQARR